LKVETKLIPLIPPRSPHVVKHDHGHKDPRDKCSPSGTYHTHSREAKISIDHHPVKKHVDHITENNDGHCLFGLGQALCQLPESLKKHKRKKGKSNNTEVGNSKIHHLSRLIEVVQAGGSQENQ